MDITMLLDELGQRHIIISVSGTEKLSIDAPKGALTPELATALREHKAALLAMLTGTAAKPSPPAAGRRFRPTAAELATWDAYYGNCTWYAGKNTWNDNPIGLALEYACLGHIGSCVSFLSNRLFTFYARCEPAHILDEQEPIEPRQYTELLRAAYERQDAAAVRQLAEPFHGTERIQKILAELHNVTAGSGSERQRQDEQVTVTPDESRKTSASASQGRTSARTRRNRVTVYADWKAGRAVTDTGRSLSFPASGSLSELAHSITAAGIEVERIYLCRERPADYAAWLMDKGMFAEYTPGKNGHFFDEKDEEKHLARWQHRASGRELEVQHIYTWFGDECTPEQASAAMNLLTQSVQRAFSTDTPLYRTPSLTFQTLWTIINRRTGKTFPLLPPEIRQLIRETSGQGRVELLTPDELERISEIDYYDGRFMYAALTWGMPTELASHDFLNEYAGKVPARYRIRFTVPENWRHVGLFMVPKDAVTGNARDKGEWLFPGEKYAGQSFETWADGSELDVAYNLPAGMPRWNIEILERMVFKPERESAAVKPLDTITEKLRTMREQLAQAANDERTPDERKVLYQLAAAGARNILLHGIGSFHRHERAVTILASRNDAPDEFIHMSPEPLYDDVYAFQVMQKTAQWTQQFEHPEWSALIWARCRARMTRAALSVPREHIIAIRTDAIALCAERSEWNENEQIGQLRRKWVIKRNLSAPHSFEALDKYVHQYARKDK